MRLKLIELRGKMSRRHVSKHLNITTQALGAIERGSRTPSLPLAKKIADFYGFSIEEIFFCN